MAQGGGYEYNTYFKPMDLAFSRMMEKFSVNSSKTISSFGEKYRNSFSEIFNDILANTQYDAEYNPIVTTNRKVAESETNAAYRTMQAKI
jgi:hypothetical protein